MTKPMNPAKINFKNIKKFIQGWTRSIILKLSKNKFINKFVEDLKLLPSYKVEQYEWRLKVMNPECLNSGKCIICGCETPYLQMSDEKCEGRMLS